MGPPPGSEQGFWPSQLPGGQEGQVCTLVPDGPRGQRALEGPRHLALGSQAEHISNSAASWVGGPCAAVLRGTVCLYPHGRALHEAQTGRPVGRAGGQARTSAVRDTSSR